MKCTVIKGKLTSIDTDSGDIDITIEDGESMRLKPMSQIEPACLLSWADFIGEDVDAIVFDGNVKDICRIIE